MQLFINQQTWLLKDENLGISSWSQMLMLDWHGIVMLLRMRDKDIISEVSGGMGPGAAWYW